MKYYDVFGEGGYHSAFMTTYAFGVFAFEDVPFPKLRGAGCRNIVVLADKAMINQAFTDFGSPRFAGTSYHLIKAEAPAAFHPKITMFLGETKGRLLVSSANLTALGLGGNKEQVASIVYTSDQSDNAKHFTAAIDYMRRYVPEDDPWFEFALQRALRSSPWVQGVGSNAAFLSTGVDALNLLFDRPDMNLLDQAIACIGNDPVERLVVLSPYWDAKLEGLSRLKDALGGPPIDILISKSAEGFPSDQLRKLAGVQVFDVSANAAKRFLHAKLIIAQGANWDHVISGSMNCTYPALFGPAAGGNAEAAIYKRVPSGTALRALGLAEYSGARLEGEQLEQLAKEFVTRETAVVAVDGGTLILQSDRLVWTKPKKLNAEPSALRLLDKEGSQVAQFELDERHARSWNLDHAKSRPKVGELIFKNGIIAAPIQVVDLDHLAVNTLPSQRGRKKQLVDAIAETLYEDLALYEQLNQLEAIQEEEELAALARVPKTAPVRREEMARRYEVLSYEEFIRARTIANAQGKAFGTFLNSRQDRASNLISASLNRMIGLVGVDLKDIEEKDLQFQNSIDFRTTEPSSLDDEGAAIKLAPSPNQSNHSNKQGLATAKKLQEAVSAFERRCKAKQDQRITTSEIVRLRALLQVILSYAQPLVGSFSDSQVLPIYNPEGHDWPRLVGRLVRQHFGVSRALEFLSVEQDEAEQQRVIEYFALAVWATKAAHSAVLATPDAANLKRPIASLQQNLIEQVKVVLRHVDNDKYYFDQISTQLDLRFKNRLGLMRQT